MTELDANPDAEAVFQAAAICRDCESAKVKRHHGFMAECRGCCARATARMPQFAESRKAGVMTHEYRRLLDQFGLTHDQVKAAAAADKAAKS